MRTMRSLLPGLKHRLALIYTYKAKISDAVSVAKWGKEAVKFC